MLLLKYFKRKCDVLDVEESTSSTLTSVEGCTAANNYAEKNETNDKIESSYKQKKGK